MKENDRRLAKKLDSITPIFTISIHDGWVEYSYPFILNNAYSINEVAEKIYKLFKETPQAGKRRRRR